MPSSDECVLEIFKGLESGDGAAFFEHVADDVDWTVMGTHPLAGHYLCKRVFGEGTFAKLGQVLTGGCSTACRASDCERQSGDSRTPLSGYGQERNALR